MENNLSVTNANSLAAILGNANGDFQYYVSFDVEKRENKAKLVNALTGNCERLKDHVNETIELVDFVIHPVDVTDTNTGEVTSAVRTVLFSENGTTYACTSVGVKNALKAVVMTYGEPTMWDEPVKVKVIQLSRGMYNILSLQIV